MKIVYQDIEFHRFRKIISACCFIMLISFKGSVAQLPSVSSGRIIRIENFQSKYVNPRNVDIWLPDGYFASREYAVLYIQDGQMLFDSTSNWNHKEWGVDETVSRLIAEKKIRPCIVVGIWNGGAARHSEYFPQKPFNLLPEAYRDTLLSSARRTNGAVIFSGEIESDNYLKFIVKELKPFIDSSFSTFPGCENTFIAGSSMGGLISLYAICEYPGVFGGAACLSTHWTVIDTAENNLIPGAIMNYIKEHLPDPVDHKIYFDYGTETLDTLYEPYQLQVDEIMKAKGYKEKNWETLKFPGEEHSENAWSRRLEIPLKFLLGLAE
jgi:enterochelin esterase-like enzyme